MLRRGLLLFWVVGIPVPFSQLANKFHAFFGSAVTGTVSAQSLYMLHLFPDEKVLFQSADGTLTLTNRRVWHDKRGILSGGNRNIMLESIGSCRTGYVYFPLIPVVGLVFGVVVSQTINQNQQDIITVLLSVAGVTGFLFLITRRNAIIIQTSGLRLRIRHRGMSQEQLIILAEKIKEAMREISGKQNGSHEKEAKEQNMQQGS